MCENVVYRPHMLTKIMQPAEIPEEQELQRALCGAREKHGPEHYSVAYRLMQLGELFEHQQRLPEAEEAFLNAAQIYRSLGADHELLCAIALKAAISVVKLQGRNDVQELNREVRQIIANHRPID